MPLHSPMRSGQATRRRVTAPAAVWLALGALLAPVPAPAQARLKYRGVADATRAQPVVFSISGGISLGAYQAGVNWGLLEVYRAASLPKSGTNRNFAEDFKIPRVELGAVAGASAGNINTLLWAIEGCTLADTALPPEASLFWQVWTAVGVPQLLPHGLTAGSSDRALFDRAFFRDTLFPRLRQRLAKADLQPCLIRIGITLTRIRPDTLHLDKLDIPTQRFATAFNAVVDSASPGIRFTLPSGVSENQRFGKLVLARSPGTTGPIPADTIFAIAEASSAFPLAFQPKQLALYYPDAKRVESHWYLDGGIFDNNPVSLALELFASADPGGVLKDTLRDTVSLIFVNPGKLRGRLETLRRGGASPVARGGMRSAMQTLGGAVGTARQYELQLWARDSRIDEPDTLIVRLTSRAHPILGEHLNHFGAFLARPFREYDFYVGVYDALHFVAREFTCRGESDSLCVPHAVSQLIGGPFLNYGPMGPPLLAKLFAEEFQRGEYAPLREARYMHRPWRGNAGDSAKTRVLLELHEAQRTQYDTRQPNCTNLPLAELALCTDGLLELLSAFRRSGAVVRAVERWRNDCFASVTLAAARDSICQESIELLELVKDPARYVSRMVDRLLERLWAVEHALHQDFERERQNGGATGRAAQRFDAERPAVLLISLYRARPLRRSYGFEWSATSAPEDAWFPRYFLPYYLGANLGSAGIELGMRPTLHLNSTVALTFPLGVHRTLSPSATRSTPTDRRKATYLGAGAGVGFKGIVPMPASLIVPELGLSAQLLGPTSGWGRGTLVMGEAYADLSLIAGRLRIAVRHASKRERLFNGGRWGGSIGIADFNGLVYWFAKLLH